MNIASKLPVYGDDITAVQGMTSVVDSLIGDSAPQFMNVLTTLKNAQLSTGDGQLNIQPILERRRPLSQPMNRCNSRSRNIRICRRPYRHSQRCYNTGKTQLTKLADRVDQLSGTFQIPPNFLGSGQARTYALMAMTTSEERSSGA